MQRTLRLAPGEPTTSDIPPDWDDADLVQALVLGDATAATVLYERLRPSIDMTLRRILQHRHRDFEDLMQTTFERVLRGLAENRFEGRSSLKTWASGIASHVALDALRAGIRHRRRTAEVDENELPHKGRTEARLEAIAELKRVQGVLARMKPALAETLILHDVMGHSLKDIAASRDAGLSATQSRLHRARLELKRRMARVIAQEAKASS